MKNLLFLFALAPIIVFGQTISTVAGTATSGYSGDTGPATIAELNHPVGIAIDPIGNLYIADFSNHVVRLIKTSGTITTIAGSGTAGYIGDGGAATAARLNSPAGVALDAAGNLYIAEFNNHVIRKVTPTGIISTVAGTGTAGYSGDGSAATLAKLNKPTGVFKDASGNIVIADYSNHVIRQVNSSGIISTIAGTYSSPAYSGDGGPATLAKLNYPQGICRDAAGNIYIGDANNSCIRKINTSGIIATIAGTGVGGYTADGIPATSSNLYNAYGVAVDGASNVYIADQSNHRVRKVNSAGIISTIAGDGTLGFFGDGGVATAAKLNTPSGVAVGNDGTVYIVDQHNSRVRKLGCVNTISHQPSHDTTLAGGNAKYWVSTTTPMPFYQWQQNLGTGFINLSNVPPYSGVTTDTLKITGATTTLDSTHYRCVISYETMCTDTSSNAILIVDTLALGINTFATSSIDIYPNPTGKYLTISSHTNMATIDIYNMMGQLVLNQRYTAQKVDISVADLPSGIYVIKVNGTTCKKFLKE